MPDRDRLSGLCARAGRVLGGDAAAVGVAPGRCTLVGEHVDYADGRVLCIAIDLAVAVAIRAAPDGRWRLRSRGREVVRDRPHMVGDLGDRVFAGPVAMQRRGLIVPPLEIGVAATLPEGAGLSSSAAVCLAVIVAVLRLTGNRLDAGELAAVALEAERDIAGLPVGPLDQRAIALAPGAGALLLDCRDGGWETVRWGIPGHALVVCRTGVAHDVGGDGYRTRRREAAAALAALGVGSYRDLDGDAVAAANIDEVLRRRARHIVTETARSAGAAGALASGDAALLGRLMGQSHASLRDDYQVSTSELDAVVGAASASDGCLGARLVGAGFGGSVVALVSEPAAPAVREAMDRAASGGRSWLIRPAPGLAELAPDVVTPAGRG